MSEREISCVVIRHNTNRQRRLVAALRASDFQIRWQQAGNLSELKRLLSRLPALLFCPANNADNENTNKLIGMLERHAPDCIFVNLANNSWQGLSISRGSEIETCTLNTNHPQQLRQQIDYLCAYVRLKKQFRQCKHLLNIAELRSQWLVDYAREAVAYIALGRHLHANIAYLSLFGFSSEAEVLSTGVLNLVAEDEQATFSTLSHEAERGANPSSKLLLTLVNRHKKSFRAEIRFIPSVFRGRRCVQLHIHPILTSHDPVSANDNIPVLPNPWDKPATSGVYSSNKNPEPKRGEQSAKSTALPQKRSGKMQANFQELLSLRGNRQESLSVAHPSLYYSDSVKVDYNQLLANAHDVRSRFRLDFWNIHASIKQLKRTNAQPIQQYILLTLGNWLFQKPDYVAELLTVLKKSTQHNHRLLLAIDSEQCLRNQALSLKIFPLLRETGVNIVLDNVRRERAEITALLKLSEAKLIRTPKGYGQLLEGQSVISDHLQNLLQSMYDKGVLVIVNGVRDINSLNLLCETTATFMQGEILEKFKR